MSWYYGFRPYVPVAQRRAQAERAIAKRTKKGQTVSPVRIEGRKITTTFWGQAWCTNLESYSDYANRLPRGRSYVRNGLVVDLQIAAGRITALVHGSDLYKIQIKIAALPKHHWHALKVRCAGQIGSLVELLQGKLSKSVMELVTDRDAGLFPKPKEITMQCSCPDSAGMCKHLAAVLYGVGNRFDSSPEMLFVLRAVDHMELIEQAIPAAPVATEAAARTIATNELGAVFGIEIDDAPASVAVVDVPKQSPEKKPRSRPAKKQSSAGLKRRARAPRQARWHKAAAPSKSATSTTRPHRTKAP